MTTTDTDGICRCGHPLEFHERGECLQTYRFSIAWPGDYESWSPVEQCECRTADPA